MEFVSGPANRLGENEAKGAGIAGKFLPNLIERNHSSGGFLCWVGSNPRTQRKRTPPEEQPPHLIIWSILGWLAEVEDHPWRTTTKINQIWVLKINFGGCSSGGVLFFRILSLETSQQRNPPGLGFFRSNCALAFVNWFYKILALYESQKTNYQVVGQTICSLPHAFVCQQWNPANEVWILSGCWFTVW